MEFMTGSLPAIPLPRKCANHLAPHGHSAATDRITAAADLSAVALPTSDVSIRLLWEVETNPWQDREGRETRLP